MTGIQVKYQTIMLQDQLKPSVESKVAYMNDVIGNLFDVVHKFQREQRHMMELINILLHFKYQLNFLKQNNISFEQAKYYSEHFASDFEICLKKFQKLLEDYPGLFDFIKTRERACYSTSKEYQLLENEFEIDMITTETLSSITLDNIDDEYQIKRLKPSEGHIGHTNTTDDKVSDNNNDIILIHDSYDNYSKFSENDNPTDQDYNEQSMQKHVLECDSPSSFIKKVKFKQTRMLNKCQTNPSEKTEPEKNTNHCIHFSTQTVTETTLPTLDPSEMIVIDFHNFKPPNISMFYGLFTSNSKMQPQWKCKIPGCNYTSLYSQSMCSHVYKHFALKPFQCSNCDYKSDARKGLIKHCKNTHKYSAELFKYMKYFRAVINKSNDDYLYQCRFGKCLFETKHSVVLIGHMNWHLSQHPFRCAYCTQRFSDLELINRHLHRAHKRRRMPRFKELKRRCIHQDCDFYLEEPDFSQMIEHMKAKHYFSKTVPKQMSSIFNTAKIKDLPMTSSNKAVLNLNDTINNGDSKVDNENNYDVGFSISYSCSYKNCRFKSKSVTQIRAHEYRRHMKEVLRCSQDDCGIIFNNKVELNEHLLNDHAISPFRCHLEGCNKGFSNATRLKIHIRDNHNEAYLSCEVCKKRFSSRHYMRRHLRQYHQAGQYDCPQDGCDFQCTYQIDLIKHSENKHTRMRKCTFEGCGTMVPKYLYNNHMNRHLNIKNHTCSWPECGKSFVDRKSLKDHARIHLNFKRFKCTWPDCGYGSEQRANVTKHIRIRHLKLPYTKKQERELNIDFDSLPHKPQDFIQVLPEDIRI